MASVTESHPQGWSFTPEQGVTRDWVPEIYKNDQLQFAMERSEKYDFTAIFYEVSYSPDHGFFYAIGPLLLNFEALVLPMKARYSCDNKKTFTNLDCKLQPKWLGFGNSNILMDAPDLPTGKITLEIELANGFKKEFEIDNKPKAHNRVVIATMQKDNNIKWIVDWLNYYRSLGVFDFRIYDNGSNNVSDLVDAIRTEVPNDVNVLVTHWPYPFGIHPLVGTLFSQRSIVLDSLYQSSTSDWFIHCDIDEYFMVDEKYSDIADFLDTFDSHFGCIQFSCSNAMLMKDKSYPDEITIRDLVWRMKEIKNKYKNACRPSATITAGVHFVHLDKGFDKISPTEPEALYLHALPLTTGWHSSTRQRAYASTESGKFVKDRRVSDRMNTIDNNLKEKHT